MLKSQREALIWLREFLILAAALWLLSLHIGRPFLHSLIPGARKINNAVVPGLCSIDNGNLRSVGSKWGAFLYGHPLQYPLNVQGMYIYLLG